MLVKAMVLAAGKGTRLAPLTGEIPKPLAPVAGKPIIQHIFELLERSGIEEVHVNVCYLADAILDHYGSESRMNRMTVRITREEELLGTAGGLKRISDCFDDTFAVIMGDALTDVDLAELVAFHKERGALATLALMRVEDTSQYGVVELDSDKNVMAFQEKPATEDAVSTLANTGIYILEPEAMQYIPENTFFDFAEDVFPRLLAAEERFVGYEGDFYWSDIGTLAAYRTAQTDVLSGKVKASIPGERWSDHLWVDQEARLHPTVKLDGQVVIGRDVVVGPAATLDGEVTVSRGCRVGAGATVRRSILLAGASVGEDAYVEDCIVGPGYEVRAEEHVRDEVLSVQARRSVEFPRQHGHICLTPH